MNEYICVLLSAVTVLNRLVLRVGILLIFPVFASAKFIFLLNIHWNNRFGRKHRLNPSQTRKPIFSQRTLLSKHFETSIDNGRFQSHAEKRDINKRIINRNCMYRMRIYWKQENLWKIRYTSVVECREAHEWMSARLNWHRFSHHACISTTIPTTHQWV